MNTVARRSFVNPVAFLQFLWITTEGLLLLSTWPPTPHGTIRHMCKRWYPAACQTHSLTHNRSHACDCNARVCCLAAALFSHMFDGDIPMWGFLISQILIIYNTALIVKEITCHTDLCFELGHFCTALIWNMRWDLFSQVPCDTIFDIGAAHWQFGGNPKTTRNL